jgi:hypothetical protein
MRLVSLIALTVLSICSLASAEDFRATTFKTSDEIVAVLTKPSSQTLGIDLQNPHCLGAVLKASYQHMALIAAGSKLSEIEVFTLAGEGKYITVRYTYTDVASGKQSGEFTSLCNRN